MRCEIQPLRPRDTGRGIAALPPAVMSQLGIGEGDYIALTPSTGNRAIAQVFPGYEEDQGSPIIRIDGQLRRNARANRGEQVTIDRVDPTPASDITVALPQDTPKEVISERLNEHLLKRPVWVGQQIPIPLGLDKTDRPVIEITNVAPDTFGVVTADTRFNLVHQDENPQSKANNIDGVSYEDIGGLEQEIEKVREMVELPMRHPQLFRQLGIDPPSGVLLHGPPGTGKTLLAEALANEVDADFTVVSGPEIVSKKRGQSEETLRETFEEASENAPAIVFFDEIDAIAPSREDSQHGADDRLVTQLLSIMDGIDDLGQVVVMGATNRVDDIDPALRRGGRFDREIEIDAPDKEGRREILEIHTQNVPLGRQVDLDTFAEQTHGFVGADLAALVKEAAMHAIRRRRPEMDIESEGLNPAIVNSIQVRESDLRWALTEVDPSAMREVIVETPEVNWDDIGGLKTPKKRLQESVRWPFDYSGVFERLDLDGSQGILLHGPPGTGKTLLAKAVANEANANFIPVKGPELLNKWVGESEKAVREVFETARSNAPAIVFFDEVDTIASERSSEGDGGQAVVERVVSQLLTELDGLEPLEDVIVIGTTNRKDLIDEALLRPGRFDQQIEVPRPNAEGRSEVFNVHLEGRPVADNIDTDTLAERTGGYSAADVEAVCREAAMAAARRHVDTVDVETIKEEPEDLTIKPEDFETALDEVDPTGEVGKDETDDEWMPTTGQHTVGNMNRHNP